jgi:hypothetical protein
METNQVSNTNEGLTVDEKKYLVTKKCDINEFTENKLNNDLEAIKKAEIRSKARVDITMDRKGTEVTRAMDALSLTNPFKGV